MSDFVSFNVDLNTKILDLLSSVLKIITFPTHKGQKKTPCAHMIGRKKQLRNVGIVLFKLF